MSCSTSSTPATGKVTADGGGDYPESLNEALHAAVNQPGWRPDRGVRLIFLLADAPPHLDYDQDYGLAPHYNTLAGGVLCYSKTLITMKKTYHSALPGPHRNRQPAKKVDISSITVIAPEEISELTQEEFDNLDGNGSTPLETRIRQRAEEQIQRTLDHPDTPPAHKGPVFRYSLMDPGRSGYPFETGAPIIVNGTPVDLPEELDCGPEVVAIAETLYRADSPFVPVSLTQEQMESPPPHQTMTSFSFHFKPEKPDPTGWCMEPVQEIIMKFTLEDSAGESRTHQVEADFHLTDDRYGDKLVRFVPGRITPESLAHYMFRALSKGTSTILNPHNRRKQ